MGFLVCAVVLIEVVVVVVGQRRGQRRWKKRGSWRMRVYEPAAGERGEVGVVEREKLAGAVEAPINSGEKNALEATGGALCALVQDAQCDLRGKRQR